jgi:hypothetical protein
MKNKDAVTPRKNGISETLLPVDRTPLFTFKIVSVPYSCRHPASHPCVA